MDSTAAARSATPLRRHTIPPDSVERGDVFTVHAHYRVVATGTHNADGQACIDVVPAHYAEDNEDNAPRTRMSTSAVADTCWHTKYSETEARPVSKTDLVDIFRRSTGRVCRLGFRKATRLVGLKATLAAAAERDEPADDADDAVAAGFAALARKFTAARGTRARNKVLNQLIRGNIRDMVALRSGSDAGGFGRSTVTDMELLAKKGNYSLAQRQVDHRTLQWIIVGGVRYKAIST
jgi:hypothetical protein